MASRARSSRLTQRLADRQELAARVRALGPKPWKKALPDYSTRCANRSHPIPDTHLDARLELSRSTRG